MKISQETCQQLLCPQTNSPLRQQDDFLESHADPTVRYPIIDGIPILINNEKSIFSIDDFVQQRDTTFDLHQNKFKELFWKCIPGIGFNLKAKDNYQKLVARLPEHAKILIVGGSIQGKGMELIYSNDSFEIVGTDVSYGPHTDVICDAHDIPFADETFDCVIIQAVLEHVLDPYRCVEEVHRVLKPAGFVYAETPFIQQVHMKQFDFTRFTHLGHRRLFRHFDEVESGPCGGPGMALAWSYTYFIESFAFSRLTSALATIFAHLTSFYLKYFDYLLIDRPRAYDAASGFYFVGQKNGTCLDDKELIQQFRGHH